MGDPKNGSLVKILIKGSESGVGYSDFRWRRLAIPFLCLFLIKRCIAKRDIDKQLPPYDIFYQYIDDRPRLIWLLEGVKVVCRRISYFLSFLEVTP
jgi:hypothetical protein